MTIQLAQNFSALMLRFQKQSQEEKLVAEKLEAVMKDYDAILTPVCSKTAYEAYDIHEAFGKVFAESVFTAASSITGTPALVTGGVQLMGKAFSESTLLSLANSVERKGE